MPKIGAGTRHVLIAIAALLGVTLPHAVSSAAPVAQDAAPPTREDREARAYELDQLKPLFDKCYEAGSDYYKNGWRSEALWCFDRATKLLPEAGN
ncbi:MAG: hypothetical protein EXS13_10400 [Planctomycetes bacterium]|nr:hypothetical protein [Planctomycetota bacterium]